MAILRVVGFDPSLRNWGVAAGTYCTVTDKLTIKSLEVISAEVPTGKQVRQNSKDLEVAFQLFQGVEKYLEHAQAIFVEVPVGSQSARAMASYGVCVGVLGSIRARGHAFIEVTPNEVKLVVGKALASKQNMIDWAMLNHPEAPWPTKTIKGVESVITGQAEHMADAAAAIRAGLASNLFKQLTSFKL